MSTHVHTPKSHIPQTYAALRYGGAPAGRAQAELGLAAESARRCEALFHVNRPGRRDGAVRPRFARDARHVSAVLAAGGYPALAL